MAACKESKFYEYFKENMEALGLPAPVSLFATQTTASGVISSILTAISRLSKNATVAELVGATTGLEKLMVVGAASASFYVGAAIGSFAIATVVMLPAAYRYLTSCGKYTITASAFRHG